jgi:hypothetical protein
LLKWDVPRQFGAGDEIRLNTLYPKSHISIDAGTVARHSILDQGGHLPRGNPWSLAQCLRGESNEENSGVLLGRESSTKKRKPIG